jgi:hypothetical protein
MNNHKEHYKLKQDYYGNEDYGKRAFWILNPDDKYSCNFVFFQDLKEWVKWKRDEGHTVEIEYAEGHKNIIT